MIYGEKSERWRRDDVKRNVKLKILSLSFTLDGALIIHFHVMTCNVINLLHLLKNQEASAIQRYIEQLIPQNKKKY